MLNKIVNAIREQITGVRVYERVTPAAAVPDEREARRLQLVKEQSVAFGEAGEIGRQAFLALKPLIVAGDLEAVRVEYDRLRDMPEDLLLRVARRNAFEGYGKREDDITPSLMSRALDGALAQFDGAFASEGRCWLPEISDRVVGTWLQSLIIDDVCDIEGGCQGDASSFAACLVPSESLGGLRGKGDWAAMEVACDTDRFVTALRALRPLVENEAEEQGFSEIGTLESIDRMIEALKSPEGQGMNLRSFMLLHWQELIERHKQGDEYLPWANSYGPFGALDRRGGDGDMLWSFWCRLADTALDLVTADKSYRNHITPDGFRYLFEHVFGLPSAILPDQTGDVFPDMPATLPFDDPRSLSTVCTKDRGYKHAKVRKRPFSEAFRFRDPADAERFRQMMGE